jgi:hypothetical protein
MPEFRAVVILTWRSETLSDAAQEIDGALDDLSRRNEEHVGHISLSRVEDITPSLPSYAMGPREPRAGVLPSTGGGAGSGA